MNWSGATEHRGEMINAHKTARKLDVIKLSGGPRSRWHDNIKMKLKYENLEWIHLAQKRV
jgi:hypothetical protein